MNNDLAEREHRIGWKVLGRQLIHTRSAPVDCCVDGQNEPEYLLRSAKQAKQIALSEVSIRRSSLRHMFSFML
jgi:hypothetical protein